VSQGYNVTVDVSSGSKCHGGRNVGGRDVKAPLVAERAGTLGLAQLGIGPLIHKGVCPLLHREVIVLLKEECEKEYILMGNSKRYMKRNISVEKSPYRNLG
jgi:hypothetical protein